MLSVGANVLQDGRCLFRVWAPEKDKMNLHIIYPTDQIFPMEKMAYGYFELKMDLAAEPVRYFFQPDGKDDFPDPASHFQPNGVHGPSEVVNHHEFQWSDHYWKGVPFQELVLYELHVGTFTREGTFQSIIPYLDDLLALGVNAIELMPVSQFPGDRNWGYDGVYPYAVQHSYGGPEGLKHLVNACHNKGIAVYLDVVYNHLGPEGNYFNAFGPYFTQQYRTPWGDAINYDGDWSDGVRDFFSDNPLHWIVHYHIDGLRCDAIHAVFDNGAVHFWQLTHRRIQALSEKLGRSFHLIAESDLNSPRVIHSLDQDGYGFRAQWLDDFHHALYVLVDQKGKERYQDFGTLEQLAKAYTDGFVHSGEYVHFRKRKYGSSSAGISGDHFVVFNQNHDQVGNRVRGERLSDLVDMDRVKLAAATMLLSPYVPMLFMGEEYAEKAPFFYFVSHSDQSVIQAVREGRKEEFKDFKWEVEPPDPQDENTFFKSKLNWQLKNDGLHHEIWEWHRDLIAARKVFPALSNLDKNHVRVNICPPGLFLVSRTSDSGHEVLCIFNFSDVPGYYTLPPDRNYLIIIDSHPKTGSSKQELHTHQLEVKPWEVMVLEVS